MDEVHEKWREFDASTVIDLLIRHCPALEMPDVFNEFHELAQIKIYNTTINDWGKSAAITNTNHPKMLSLLVVRTNMTNSILPAGLQSDDFPQKLFDLANLRTLPDGLGLKWPSKSIIFIEYSQLTNIPPSIIQLEPYYFSVAGNSITSIPFEVFENQNLVLLGISNTNIHELPRNVTQLSTALVQVSLIETNISFFWSWADELVVRSQMVSDPWVKSSEIGTALWIAGSSNYCLNLDRIRNGGATDFGIPLQPDYSQRLMNATKENMQEIEKAVDCDTTMVGILYPLAYEDTINAISIPVQLKQHYY